MKQWSDVYQNNHLRLARIHRILALTYGLYAFLGASLFPWLGMPELLPFLLPLLPLLLIHAWLISGCRRKSEQARKLSQGLFVFSLALFAAGVNFSALLFPALVAFVTAFFGLPATSWETPDDRVDASLP
ncbi:MAG: hypothetical protein LBR88_00065 [Zoogloeaceae bacterium]|jgi:ABC-type uncharacterized transport system permease subunit|nr:hypothetical protein [Zoogloeaceae bacterium]